MKARQFSGATILNFVFKLNYSRTPNHGESERIAGQERPSNRSEATMGCPDRNRYIRYSASIGGRISVQEHEPDDRYLKYPGSIIDSRTLTAESTAHATSRAWATECGRI